jgi:hypothetical protein
LRGCAWNRESDMTRKRVRLQHVYLRGGLVAIMGLFGFLLWTIAAGAQEQGKEGQASGGSPATMMHQFHIGEVGLECTECHRQPENAPPERDLVFAVRPDHTSCEDCHEEVNSKQVPQGKMCQICHAQGEPQVGPFPSGKNTLTHFSHTAHLDPQGRRNAQGVRLDCVLCHTTRATQRVPTMPGHAQCRNCHAGDGAVAPIIAAQGESKACATCHDLPKIDAFLATRLPEATTPAAMPTQRDAARSHATTAAEWETAKGVPYRDIVPFPHNRHLQRRDGTAIDCVTCHSAVLQRQGFEQHAAVPPMKQCASCHDNASWVRQAYQTKQCRVCHTTVRADMRPLMSDPVSPSLVHHAGFARSHQQQASATDSLCGMCHRGFVNVGVDKCAGCHSSMRPRSHNALRFSEIWHGRQAAFNRQACATCHTSDFCVSCHSVPPRSHVPLPLFRNGGHRQIARLNPRSCLVSHQFENTCQECHNRQLRR